MTRLRTWRTPGAKLRTAGLLMGSMLFCAPLHAQTSGAEDVPKITSAGPIGTEATQKFVIRGLHFGTYKPYNGCEPFLRITNLRNNQAFGQPGSGPCTAVLVTSWTDSEIVVEGFSPFERGLDVFNVGDVIRIEVANPQQEGSLSSGDNFNGAPVAWFSARVGGEPGSSRVAREVRGDVTIPAGQSVLIRMIDRVDSSKNQVGDIFHASLETDLDVNGTVVARKGTDVYGRLAQAKEAGHLAGSSELQLELTRMVINGHDYPIFAATTRCRGKDAERTPPRRSEEAPPLAQSSEPLRGAEKAQLSAQALAQEQEERCKCSREANR
jgi:hypothetical protein